MEYIDYYRAHVKGLSLLATFYWENLALLTTLPHEIRNPAALNDLLYHSKRPQSETLELTVPNSIKERYSQGYTNLKECMRELHKGLPSRPFHHTIYFMMAVRLSCLVAAALGHPLLAFFLGLLQFAVAPYSLFAAVTMFMALAPPVYAGHYAAQVILQNLRTLLLPSALDWSIPIDNTFILLFLAADQLACAYCYFQTGLGPSARLPLRTTLVHVGYGFLNTKTYSLLLLLLCRGHSIPLFVWLVDAFTGLSGRLATICAHHTLHWALLFYHQHRMVHLPRVYESAHKFHHYLHDTNAFDAHIYGSGLPEEWLGLWVEVAGQMALGYTPTSLSYHTLTLSWSNKVGHTRKADGSGGVNHHADHHTWHSKNYGIYNALLDLYFGTNAPDNEEYQMASFNIKRTENPESGTTILQFARAGSGPDAERLQERYFSPDPIRTFFQTTVAPLFTASKHQKAN
ncbi:Fatty acid hydroxylase domain-containing protein [Balamuthia mandrillaris]